MHSIAATSDLALEGNMRENDIDIDSIEEDSDLSDRQLPNEPEETSVEIAHNETRRLCWIRMLVACVLMASTIGMASAVHRFTSGIEQREFKTALRENAAKILGDVRGALKFTLGAVDTFSMSLLSYARTSNSTWPFVTNPDFVLQASKLRRQAKAFVVTSHVLVSTEQREAWQSYSVANDAWVNQSVALLAQDKSFHGIIMKDWTVNSIISGLDGGPIATPGPYLPLWQVRSHLTSRLITQNQWLVSHNYHIRFSLLQLWQFSIRTILTFCRIRRPVQCLRIYSRTRLPL